jgi:hypothetical protein
LLCAILKGTMKLRVTLKVYSTVEEATLARDYLAEHGVDATVHVDETAAMHPSSNSVTGIMVLVPADELEKAQELLQIN